MDELIAFLNARLDEDEDGANAAAGLGARTRWTREYISCVVDAEGKLVVYGEGTPTREQADHIARHDPARVLADVAAKRRILARVLDDAAIDMPGAKAQGVSSEEWYLIVTARDVIKMLALPYADHPDYDEFHWGLPA